MTKKSQEISLLASAREATFSWLQVVHPANHFHALRCEVPLHFEYLVLLAAGGQTFPENLWLICPLNGNK